jgi:branched-chain amino acid transport system ATP-binding protein
MLEVRNLSKAFGGLKAVDGVDLDVRAGEILGVIGPNGAGKTTLFNLLSGFLAPGSGTISYLGRNIVGLQPYEIAKLGLTRTFQIVKPFVHLSVLQNVMVGAYNRLSRREESEVRAREMIRFVRLDRKTDSFASTLNLGQLKRLEIAKALAAEPKLLLLDEVMAGITDAEREELVEVIRGVRESGVSIVLIGHELKAIMKVTERLIVMNFGRKIAEGPPREVIQTPEVVDAYLGAEYDCAGNP